MGPGEVGVPGPPPPPDNCMGGQTLLAFEVE